jgi:O-antigen ligase
MNWCASSNILRVKLRSVFLILGSLLLIIFAFYLPLNVFFMASFLSVYVLVFLYNPLAGLVFFLFFNALSVTEVGELTTIYLGTFGDINVIGLMNLLFLIMGTIFLIKKKVNISSTPIKYFILLILVSFLIAISFSFFYGFVYILHLSVAVVAFFMSYYFFNDIKKFKTLIKIFIITSIIPLIYAFYQLIMETGDQKVEDYNRVFGTFNLSTVFARYLIILLILSIFWIVYKKKIKKQDIFYLILVASIFSLMIIFTYTRMVWIGVAFSILLFSFFYFRSRLNLILISFGMIFFLVPGFASRFNSIISEIIAFFTSGVVSGSASFRITHWGNILEQYIQSGYLVKFFGFGLGTVFNKLSLLWNRSNLIVHSDIVAMLVETGIVGLVFYLIFWLKSIKKSIKGIKIFKKSNSKYHFSILLFVLILTSFVLNFDNFIFSFKSSLYFWVLIGSIFSIISNKKFSNERISVAR